MTTPKPCLYLRCSSTMQADANGVEMQRHALTNWVRGAAVTPADSDWFTDLAESGRNPKRPAFNAMLARIKAGDYDTLVTYSLSRLGRRARGLLDLVDLLKEHEVKLVVLKESIDSTSATGRLFLLMVAGFAEYESELMGERIRDGIKRRKAAGKPVGPKWSLTPAQMAEAQALSGTMSKRAIARKLGKSEFAIGRLLRPRTQS